MKLSEHSVATALARRVLPVPGGPYNKIPVITHVYKKIYFNLNVNTLKFKTYISSILMYMYI